uniref:Uncharacterized protein n=1 Tax=Panagrolaimus sp. JU765 TaxID=591449 RepID=A0AC34RAY4_9BILA
MMEMLTNCQVEVLEIDNMSFLSKSSDFLDILVKSLKFVTKLIFEQSITETETATIIDFYRKFRHLNTLVYKQNPFILPHYPPNVVVEHANHRFIGEQYLNFFQDLAKFSRQSPLSSLKIYNYISCDHLRQFLTTARFAKDAEIFAKFHVSFFSLHQVYLRYNERNTFEFEDYPSEAMVVTVDQQITGENERILLLSRMNLERALGFTFTFDFSFDVISASSRNQPIYSGILTRYKQAFKLENVKSNDWIKVKFDPGKFHHDVRYSKNFLNTHFPRSDDVPYLNYLDKINIVLDTQIGITNSTLKNI